MVFEIFILMQQSAIELQLLPVEEKSFKQLSIPHLRFLLQSESRSQSPCPTSQGVMLVQQLASVTGTPSHPAALELSVKLKPLSLFSFPYLSDSILSF